MKKLLLVLLLLLPVASQLSAQEYQPLQVMGFTADVIANGINPSLSSTTDAMDNAEYAFVSADFQPTVTDTPPSYALPVSGLISDPALSGLTFQISPYSQNNSLRLQETSDFGLLTVISAVSATKLYILAASGSGSVTVGGTIYFSDNTTQTFSGGIIPDWFFSNALPVVISSFGRVKRTTDIIENPTGGDPRLYRYEIDILPLNQTKTITGIDFTKTSTTEGVANIFAISAELIATCPAPTSVTASDITENSATISWNPAVIVPALGYDYYVTTGTGVPAASQTPTGNVTATTIDLSSLLIGQHYCVWVRSHCSATETGNWVSACFTTAQVTTPYTGADIPTLFDTAPTVITTTTCPGTLTVHVPDGFQISSVATVYQMQTASNGWMSEQRSLLFCNTTSTGESAVTSGVGGMTGTFTYSRSNIHIADGATGNVNFELRAWRTFGTSDCNVDFNRVLGNSWTVTITYQPQLKTEDFNAGSFAIYPNPTQDLVHITAKDVIQKMQVFNLLGQEVLQQNNVNAKETQCSLSGLPMGKYLLRITSAGGVEAKSILKQ